MLMADSGATAGLRYVDPPTNRNLIINGAMQVAQRGTSSTGITAAGYYTADRWGLGLSLGTWTQSVENDAPTGSGLRKSQKMLVTTAAASPAAGNLAIIRQLFEGQDLQRIRKGTSDAQQLTLSFWVKSNVTGTFVVEMEDNDNSRAVSTAYTVAAADIWERKTITLPADTTGALDNDNAGSMRVNFWLGAGTTYTSGTLSTTWTSTTNANRAVGQTNLSAATDNYWQVTGVQLETGPVATPFEFEPFEATLRKCQRYYYLHASGTNEHIGPGGNYSSTIAFCSVKFPVTMRTEPSLVATSGTDYYIIDRNGGTDAFNSFTLSSYVTPAAAQINNTSEISGTAGHFGMMQTSTNAAASVAFSAEL
jgi:hypothetical protein